jgi:hypothetical protein
VIGCEAFERWLDEGRPGESAAEARAHATRCERCAVALAAELELEAALAMPPEHAAPAGFTGGVLTRIAAARRARPLAAWVIPPLDWWLRAAADPPAALALALAGLVLWYRAPLWSAAGAAGAWLAGLAGSVAGVSAAAGLDLALPSLGGRFTAPAAIVAFAPVVLFASWWLYRWADRAMARAACRGLVAGR